MISIVFEKFLGVILIALIVIFQEEIRHFFERVAAWSLNRDFGRKAKIISAYKEAEILVRILFDLARERIGALVVIKGKDVLARHLDGGTDLNGTLSAALLKSLFDPHSAGHDGAAIIEGNRVIKFSCHLPLSKNLDAIHEHGTRHAAALGLAELSDALCLVVSEERGTISMAYEAELKAVSEPTELITIIDEFYQKNKPKHSAALWRDVFKKTFKEKVYAVLIALGLWFVLVYGAEMTYKSFDIPIPNLHLLAAWIVRDIDPKELKITLRGTQKILN